MEQTKVTYRGRELFTLGHFGTFINYILIFLFGIGWLSAGVVLIVNSKDGSLIFPIVACVVGLGIMFIAYIAMYDNRKEVIENRKFDKDIKLISEKLEEIKSAYKDNGKSVHRIVDNSKEGEVIVDNFVWNVFEKLLPATNSFSNSQLTLLTKIYDGLELDSYDFLLDNGLIKDKFIRKQVVAAVKDIQEAKAGTRMIVKMKLDPPSFAPHLGNSYLCEIIGTNSRVLVSENEIEAA